MHLWVYDADGDLIALCLEGPFLYEWGGGVGTGRREGSFSAMRGAYSGLGDDM